LVHKSEGCEHKGLAERNKRGDLEKGFAFAGANAYLVDKIISVKELIETLIEEYTAVAMQQTTAGGIPA
jgi:NAD(P)H-dependent flavin oxidoreductase YrpB (nitropropane dioxygenase family)